jgi:hypothetical protein
MCALGNQVEMLLNMCALGNQVETLLNMFNPV